MQPLIPPEVEASFTLEDFAGLVHYFREAEEKADAARRVSTEEHHNFYDELFEISIGYRMRLEAGDPKGAAIYRLQKIVDIAVAHRWPRKREGLDSKIRTFVQIATTLLKMNPMLISGSTPAERIQWFQRLRMHAESLWLEAVYLYRNGSSARACFLAITCLEEIGKAAISRFYLKAESIAGALEDTPLETATRQKNPFFAHKSKHFLAAASGAIFNPRLDTLFGPEETDRLINLMEAGHLVELRERCLYVNLDDGQIQWPDDEVASGTATTWIVLAGELLAEVLGYPESEWSRLIEAAEAFERSVAIPRKPHLQSLPAKSQQP